MPLVNRTGVMSARAVGFSSLVRVALGGTSTFDPATAGTDVVVSGGDRIMSKASAGYASAIATNVKTNGAAGRYYLEFSILTAGNVAVGNVYPTLFSTNTALGSAGGQSSGWYANGDLLVNNVVIDTYATYTQGDTLGYFFDGSTSLLWLSKNGVWQDGNPASGTGGLSIGAPNVAFGASAQSGGSVSANCGQDPFRFDIPPNSTAWG